MASLNPSQAQIQQMITAAAQQYGVDPALALGVAQTESNFSPTAVSSAGAVGVMQLMPATAAGLGVDPNDPQQNIDGGVRLLSQLLTQYNGNVQQALWAYNAGPSSVASGNLPAETANYIPTVLANAQNYSGIVPSDMNLLENPDLTASGQTLTSGLDLPGDVTLAGLTVPTSYVIAGGILLFGLIAWAISR
jgi:soluble lytic murein transglycosylase-like protein